jgi:hypothetical protein
MVPRDLERFCQECQLLSKRVSLHAVFAALQASVDRRLLVEPEGYERLVRQGASVAEAWGGKSSLVGSILTKAVSEALGA